MCYKNEINWIFSNKEDLSICSLCDMRTNQRHEFDNLCNQIGGEIDAIKLDELVEAASKSTDKDKLMKVLDLVTEEVQANIIYYGICKTEDEFSSFVERSYVRFTAKPAKKEKEHRGSELG